MSIRPDDPEAPSSPLPSPADPVATTLLSSQPAGADPAATHPLIPPPTPPLLPSLPGYEILRELGRGGMGVVYQARQLGFNRIVALKMILAGSYAGDDERERFRIEAEAVARLQHPNIVQVYEVGEHEGKPFFSMEFCPGGALDKKLNGTPLPPREAAALVETLARAVQAAHDKGVVHRDLKPANVLLAEDGAPKVTDFGLAKRMDAVGPTQTGLFMGSASYTSPEQAGGKSKDIGPACDVYALGAILYECLTGRPPFKGPSALETLAQVLSNDPVPPRQLRPKTPCDLEAVALRCLEKDRARRYATAQDLAQDLQRFLDARPVKARPVGPARRVLRRTARAVRRRPGVVLGVLASVTLGLLAGFLGPRLLAPMSLVQSTTPVSDPIPAPTPTPTPDPVPDPLPADLALVPADAAGFVSVREADLIGTPQFAEFRRRIAKADPQADQQLNTGFTAIPYLLGLQPADMERVTLVFLKMPRIDAAYQSYLVIVSTNKPYDPARRPLLSDVFQVLQPFALHPLNDHLVLIGPSEAVLQEFGNRTATPQPQGPLAAALRVAAQPRYHAVIGLNPPPEFLKTFGEKMPNEKGMRMRDEVMPVTEMQSASIALTLAPPPPDAVDLLELQIDARLKFADAAKAKSGAEAARRGLGYLHDELTDLKTKLGEGKMKPEDLARPLGGASSLGFASLQFLYPVVDALSKANPPEQQGDTVSVHLDVRSDAQAPDVSGTRLDIQAAVKEANNRTARVQQLEAIGKALKQYAAAHDGRLPPAELRGQDGRPLLSWRVLLLPYLGQEKLFQQFRLDEPWDGPNNRPLLDKMPSAYAAPVETPEAATSPYQVLVGKGTPFEAGLELSLEKLGRRKKPCFLVVEAREAVAWTRPQDLPFSPEGPLPKLGVLSGEPGFAALFADGSARSFHAPVNDTIFRALIRRDGDEKIDLGQLP